MTTDDLLAALTAYADTSCEAYDADISCLCRRCRNDQHRHLARQAAERITALAAALRDWEDAMHEAGCTPCDSPASVADEIMDLRMALATREP